ncbi:Uncharacterized protein TCAP_01972 [Tolypocladium capitatum]|uniref:Uncharacterized protein n=1 Tax=Tolypocladium capitatum TaxID=45235 RepID=A0A2K3QKN9_9HYPO|nr:Uncharacterized protein TCAP_01972 [Tolypocladium capitatum]
MAPETSTQTATLPTEQRNSSNPVQPAQPYVLYSASYGEPFAPYSGNQGQQLVTVPHPVVPERKAWRITKDVLHAVAIVVSIVGLGVGFSLLGFGFNVAIGTVAACPVFAVALVWSVAEEITLWVRKRRSGVHPGAHVGISLFLWLACAVVGGILAAYVGMGGVDYDCNYYDSSGNITDCGVFYGNSWGRVLAVDVLVLLLWLVHFILFIGACVDTAKRNAARSKPIMVVAQPPYWGPGPPQGWQQPMTQQLVYQQPQATSPQAVSGEGQGSGDGKQPEMPQHPTPADHGVREFYTPAGSGSAA